MCKDSRIFSFSRSCPRLVTRVERRNRSGVFAPSDLRPSVCFLSGGSASARTSPSRTFPPRRHSPHFLHFASRKFFSSFSSSPSSSSELVSASASPPAVCPGDCGPASRSSATLSPRTSRWLSLCRRLFYAQVSQDASLRLPQISLKTSPFLTTTPNNSLFPFSLPSSSSYTSSCVSHPRVCSSSSFRTSFLSSVMFHPRPQCTKTWQSASLTGENVQSPFFFPMRWMYTTRSLSSAEANGRARERDLEQNRMDGQDGENSPDTSDKERMEEESGVNSNRTQEEREREEDRQKRQTAASATQDSRERDEGGEEGLPRVYRQPPGMVQHVFQWGIGNAFRAVNANRFRPVHAARPKEVSIHPSYFDSPHPFMIWEPLNEAWEVYFFENFKKSAKPFPVKKFGIARAKREALEFLSRMKDAGRLEKPRFTADDEGVAFDQVTGSWVCRYFDVETGRGTSRAFGADFHGFEEAKHFAMERRRTFMDLDFLLQSKNFLIEKTKQTPEGRNQQDFFQEGSPCDAAWEGYVHQKVYRSLRQACKRRQFRRLFVMKKKEICLSNSFPSKV